MTARLVAVTFDVTDPARVGSFWARLLDRDVIAEPDGVLLPAVGGQVGLRFAATSTPKTGRNRLHLHVTSTSRDDRQRVVDTALTLGAEHFDAGQLPEEEHVVLADPGGDEFCVIEPGNRFLAGCGRLGEVACDGSRTVGLFWQRALGWPLVWDRDDETAIQSPGGGTKISWGGGTPTAPARTRQRFDLVATDPSREAERLVALGAAVVGERGGRVGLTDPDGHELRLGPA